MEEVKELLGRFLIFMVKEPSITNLGELFSLLQRVPVHVDSDLEQGFTTWIANGSPYNAIKAVIVTREHLTFQSTKVVSICIYIHFYFLFAYQLGLSGSSLDSRRSVKLDEASTSSFPKVGGCKEN